MKKIKRIDKFLIRLNLLFGFFSSKKLKLAQLDALAESEFFNEEWLHKELKKAGLLVPSLTKTQLLQLYLKLGVKYELNPSKAFDTKYYLLANPDVRERGVNPLLHYVLFGRYEGRQPKENPVLTLVESLWGGQSEEALKELQLIQESTEHSSSIRAMAAWEQARWYSHVYDDQQALALAQKMGEMDRKLTFDKGRLLLISVCAQRGYGSVETARELLEDYTKTVGFDSDITLYLANFERCDENRLALINQVYQTFGLTPLVKVDANFPLTIANVKGVPVANAWQGNEKVSVIIPLYNAENSIVTAIQSLLEQTWENIEILVVDDCSTDASRSLVESLREAHQNIRLLKTEKNSGAYAARNVALQQALGDLITTHDADDWSHPQKIELQVKALRENNSVKGVMTHWVRCTHELVLTHNWRPSSTLIHESHSSFLCKREVIDALGEWDEVRVGADTEFMWRMRKAFGEDSIITIHKEFPLAFALDDEGSLTRSKSTHVRTINFGVRHLYRLSSMYWHQATRELKLLNGATRQFYVPEAMRKGAPSSGKYDVLLIADFHRDRLTPDLVTLIDDMSNKSVKIALLHWPKFGSGYQWLSAKVFKFAHEAKAVPVAHGQTIYAKTVVLNSSLLASTTIDRAPVVKGIEEAFIVDDGCFSEAIANLSELFSEKALEFQAINKSCLRKLLLKPRR